MTSFNFNSIEENDGIYELVADDFMDLQKDHRLITIIFEPENEASDAFVKGFFVRSVGLLESGKKVIRESVLRAILDYYASKVIPKAREYETVFGIKITGIDSPEELLAHIVLNEIHLHSDGEALKQIGFSFSCDWDREHGVGIRIKPDASVLKVGTADFSFL